MERQSPWTATEASQSFSHDAVNCAYKYQKEHEESVHLPSRTRHEVYMGQMPALHALLPLHGFRRRQTALAKACKGGTLFGGIDLDPRLLYSCLREATRR